MALPDVSQQFLSVSRAFLTQDYLPKIERCVSQLTPEQIWFRANDASNSIGNLLLHLAGSSRYWAIEVIVSPEGRVWVSRNLPAGADKTIYDVFDEKGGRVDRVELPARNRVVGFGARSIYTLERDERGTASLRKYKL